MWRRRRNSRSAGEGTVSIIDSKADREGLYEHEYYRAVTHRWAHRMATQPAWSIRKYSRKALSTVKL